MENTEKLKQLESEMFEMKAHLLGLAKALPSIGKENFEIKPGFYMFDIYITGLLNRSANLIEGFIVLLNHKNFISAAPLVRIHLDSLLRLFAPNLIDYNVDEFAMQVYQGTSLRKLKDREGKPLTDSRLVEKISKLEPFFWVKQVYDNGNSFVHFSDKTIFAAIQVGEQEGHLTFTVGQHDECIPITEKHGSVYWMIQITEGIMAIVDHWMEKKKSYLNSDNPGLQKM